MKTQTNPYTRTIFICLIFALLFSGCKAQISQEEAARAAAISLLANSTLPGIVDGGMNPIFTGNALWAVEQTLANKPGAYLMLNQAKQIAVFVSPGVRDTVGQTSYWLWGFIDMTTGSLVDVCKQFQICAGQATNAKTMAEVEKLLLDHGFQRIAPAAAPTLVATLRLAITYIRSLGASLPDLIILPAGILMPGNNPLLQDQVYIDG